MEALFVRRSGFLKWGTVYVENDVPPREHRVAEPIDLIGSVMQKSAPTTEPTSTVISFRLVGYGDRAYYEEW
jgi:hypothetical protein